MYGLTSLFIEFEVKRKTSATRVFCSAAYGWQLQVTAWLDQRNHALCKRCYLGEWNLTLTTFFIFESRSKNKSCLFMSTMHRNEWPKIHRSQERPPRLLEGHSGDSCKVPLLMHIETWNSVYGFSNVYLEHSLCQRTYSTPVRNHRRPLRLLGGRFGDTLEKYHL